MERLMIFRAALLIATACVWEGCDPVKVDVSGPKPLDTVHRLLELHGLDGKLPSNRPESVRNAAVDRKSLKNLFLDYDKEDPFLADLYVGFVVGALSVNQRGLHVFQDRRRAEVRAGNVSISMHLRDGVWRVSLKESIPDVIRARAKMEKLKATDNPRFSVR